jgi:hypothetical protein
MKVDICQLVFWLLEVKYMDGRILLRENPRRSKADPR